MVPKRISLSHSAENRLQWGFFRFLSTAVTASDKARSRSVLVAPVSDGLDRIRSVFSVVAPGRMAGQGQLRRKYKHESPTPDRPTDPSYPNDRPQYDIFDDEGVTREFFKERL